MRIGAIIRLYIEKIFNHCENNDIDELTRLMDLSYCRKTFRINYPFCAEIENIKSEDSIRYWSRIYIVCNKQVRVSSQWYETFKPNFYKYIISKKIVTEQEIEIDKTNSLSAATKGDNGKILAIKQSYRKVVVNARYRGNAIGNAQNLFVRHILSNLGDESFSENDWLQTLAYFQNQCAYCDEKTNLVMDHAVPINRKKLGEHRIGNLIPCCRNCNERKANKDFIEYLDKDKERINKIKIFMKEKKYVPLGENEKIQKILEMAYQEVGSLADRYVTIINDFIPHVDREPINLPKTDGFNIRETSDFRIIPQNHKNTTEIFSQILGFAITSEQANSFKIWKKDLDLVIAQKQLDTGFLWNGTRIRESILITIRKSLEAGRPFPYYGSIGGAYSFNFTSSIFDNNFTVKNIAYGQEINLGGVRNVYYENDNPSWSIVGDKYKVLLEWKQTVEKKLSGHGTYKYSFTPNGLGVSITVLCIETNQTVDLTDSSDW